jgi:hypothetical protein
LATGAGVRRGHDARYPGRQVAGTEPGNGPDLAAAVNMQGAGYYRAAVEAGEPPGRWWGPAVEALGLEPGSIIDHDEHAAVFEERIGPDGTKLGRSPVGKDKDGNPRPRLSPDDVYARRVPGSRTFSSEPAIHTRPARSTASAGNDMARRS